MESELKMMIKFIAIVLIVGVATIVWELVRVDT